MDELTIQKLLDGDIDPVVERENLLAIGRNTQWEPFLHRHHVEPERVEEINLTPLQHLAIHICLAKIRPTGSNHAKVACFVKAYPGHTHDHTPLNLNDDLAAQVLSFGQRRPETSDASCAYARTFVDKEKQREAVREAGRRLKGRPCTWGKEVSATLKAKPLVTCEICGTQMKDIGGNLLQHQRSSKCQKST